MSGEITIKLTIDDAKWLDSFLQNECKREGFRPHEKRKPQVVSIGVAVQEAIAGHSAEKPECNERGRMQQ